MKNPAGKKVHLEIIRFLAICLVVFNHTDGYFLYFSETGHILTYSISLFFSILCRINVPLFFMVSGALLLEKEEDIKTLYKKRVGRMAAVILIFSAAQYVGLWLSSADRGGTGGYTLPDFLRTVYSEPVIEPYWFLYSYLALLLLLPFLRRMAGAMTEAEFLYLFALKAVFDVLLRLAGVYTGITVNLELFILSDSVFYALCGYYMEHIVSKEHFRKGKSKRALLVCLGVILLSAAAVIGEYRLKGEYSQNLLGIFNPFLTLTVYYMVKSFCMAHVPDGRLRNICLYLGSIAFGIYLLEQLVRRQLLPLYLYLIGHMPGIPACFLYVTGTVALSALYVSILKRIPGIRRLL